MNKIIDESINWYCSLFKTDSNTFKNILKYLNLYEEGKKRYPITILPSIRSFISEHPISSKFFQHLTDEACKEEIRQNLKQNGYYVVKELPEQLHIEYYRVIVLLARNGIKVRKKHHIGYITNIDFATLKKASDEYNSQEHKCRSLPQKEVIDYIKSFYSGNIIENCRSLITPKEVDIYLPEVKIAIEVNGTFWHCSLNENIYRNYHLDKSKECAEKGVRLIHIYEYEWDNIKLREKIKSMLKIALGSTLTKIYARKCDIKKISNKEAKEFNEKNHLQGHRNAQVTYGLFYNGKLVQLMSFSQTRYNRNLKNENSWEIIRGCPASNNVVIGGVSKLFNCFLKEYDPVQVFSYCDFNKFDGKGYEEIGMKFIGYTGPDLKWVMPDYTVCNRNPAKHNELKEKSVAVIYGAGSKKYLWKKN